MESVKNPINEIYFSRIILNSDSSNVNNDLNDVCMMHKTLMRAFPSKGAARSVVNLLFRVDLYANKTIDEKGLIKIVYYPSIIAQSTIEPDWSTLPKDYFSDDPTIGENPIVKRMSIDDVKNIINSERIFRFRLRANPSRKVRRVDESDPENRATNNGARLHIRNIDDLLQWIDRKGDQHGFVIKKIKEIRNEPPVYGYKVARDHSGNQKKIHKITIEGTIYEGILEVTDVDTFVECLVKGIGPSKSYGFGLLSIA